MWSRVTRGCVCVCNVWCMVPSVFGVCVVCVCVFVSMCLVWRQRGAQTTWNMQGGFFYIYKLIYSIKEIIMEAVDT